MVIALDSVKPGNDIARSAKRAPASARVGVALETELGDRLGDLARGTATNTKIELGFTSLRKMFAEAGNDPMKLERANKLLTETYNVYKKCFPDPNERESKANLKGYLLDPKMDWDLLVAQSPAHGNKVVAFRSMNFLKASYTDRKGVEHTVQFVQGEHLGVHPELRLKGLSKQIIAESEKLCIAKGCKFMTSEQNDPYKMKAEDIKADLGSGLTPRARLDFWRKNGYRALNAPYMQPSLDGGAEVRYLLWGFKALDPSFERGLPKQLVLAAQRAFHGTFVKNMDKDPTCKELAKALAGNGFIGTITLGRQRSFAQSNDDLAINSPDANIRKAALTKNLKTAERLLKDVVVPE